MSSLLRTILLAASALPALLAQSNFGGIKGTVTDTSGAVIPGARVEITDTGTSARIAAAGFNTPQDAGNDREHS